jgi:hypothetical protein
MRLYFPRQINLRVLTKILKSHVQFKKLRDSSIKLALESDQPITKTAKDLRVKEDTFFV